VTPDGRKVYVTDDSLTVPGTVSVIDTRKKKVTATIAVGTDPVGVAVTPDGRKVYVSNMRSDSVSVIETKNNKVIATIPVARPAGVAVTSDGRKVYVAGGGVTVVPGTVSVIDTATNKVIGSPIPVGDVPIAFGKFIQPSSRQQFAGTPGKANCYGQSVSTLLRQFHGLAAAAAAFEFSGVENMQDAILQFCEE
jgi:YVTN family beta-propeller protein